MKTGICVPGLVRDMLLAKGIVKDYETALDFSEQVNLRLINATWLETYEGHMFKLAYTPHKYTFKEELLQDCQ